jgi:hypothetical protein
VPYACTIEAVTTSREVTMPRANEVAPLQPSSDDPLPMPSFRCAALVMLFALSACASRPGAVINSAPNAAVPDGRFVDLMGDYLTFSARSRTSSDEVAARRFRHDVVMRHAGVYTQRVFGYDPQQLTQLSPRFIAARASLRSHDVEMRAVARDIDVAWPRLRSIFQASLPDAERGFDVYVLVSLGAFDGATREVAGRPALLFGVDAIAAESLDSSGLDALALHELFHIYHARWLPENAADVREPLWLTLWREGLATLVAHRLVPSASDRALFGGDDATPAALAAEMPRLADRFRETLDASGEPAYTDWFLVGGNDPNVPQRAGYALGFAVAESIGANRSLTELARLRGPELRQQVQIALGRIAGNY